MSISATTDKRNQFSGNSDAPTAFSITFPYLAVTDVEATRTSAAGVDTVLTYTTHYALSATNDEFRNGSTITLVTGLAAGEKLTCIPKHSLTQSIDLQQGGAFNPEIIEKGFDRNLLIHQQNEEGLERSPQYESSDDFSGAYSRALPSRTDRASKVAGWDSDGNWTSAATSSASVSTGTEGWADVISGYNSRKLISASSSAAYAFDDITAENKVDVLFMTTSTNVLVVTLPAEADSDGRELRIIKADSATGTVTINNDADAIVCAKLTLQYEIAHVICDGTSWFLLNRSHNLGDSSVQTFGADGDVRLQHVADDGLILKNTGSTGATKLTIQTSNTTVTDGNILGEIDFQAPDDAGLDSDLIGASIAARAEGTFSDSSNATELVFKTGVSEDASTGAADGDMILSSAGALSASSFKLFGSVNPTPVDFGIVANSTGFQNAIAGLGTGYGECAAGGRMVASYPTGGELAITFTYAGVYLLCIQMGNSGMGANDITTIELRSALESETTATVVDLGFSGNADDRIFALSGVAGLAGANISGTGWYNVTATAGQLVQFNPRAEFTTSDDGEDINQKIFTAFMVWG